jgi:hypothetical protein
MRAEATLFDLELPLPQHAPQFLRRGDQLKPTRVAYQGTGPALNDLVGQVDHMCDQGRRIAGVPVQRLERAERGDHEAQRRAGEGADLPDKKGRSPEALEKLVTSENRALEQDSQGAGAGTGAGEVASRSSVARGRPDASPRPILGGDP